MNSICIIITPSVKNKVKSPHLIKKAIVFYQDQTLVLSCAILMMNVMKLKFQLPSFEHPLHSPDLGLNIFYYQLGKKLLCRI